jgi:cbb3-type cytochrome oxidase subunit 3
MYREILSQFDQPWLPITGLIIFVTCFLIFVFWTFKKENKEFYEHSSHIPLQDGVNHGQ